MNCKEVVYLLGDYFDGSMEPPLREELEAHIAMCEPCINFVRTYDKTRLICRQIQPEDIPTDVQARLRDFIVQKAREHFLGIEKYIRRAAEERRQQAAMLVQAYRDRQLSPMVALLFETHRSGCPLCRRFLRMVDDGAYESAGLPHDVEEHIALFLEALPPGESPIRR